MMGDYGYGIVIGLHTLAAVVWVGGMYFAHMVLRLPVTEMAPAERLGLWGRVLPRFFVWVWLAVIVLLATGYGVLLAGYRGGIAGGALHVDIMQATGLVMMVLFVALFFGPWRRMRAALGSGDLPTAAAAQGWIRRIVTVNLILGLFTIFVGAAGTFVGY
ncbi:MAG: CopD family protein [Magnetospirillum sp.]|nr:CopD family protein [Magnetospirillum sp.]